MNDPPTPPRQPSRGATIAAYIILSLGAIALCTPLVIRLWRWAL